MVPQVQGASRGSSLRRKVGKRQSYDVGQRPIWEAGPETGRETGVLTGLLEQELTALG